MSSYRSLLKKIFWLFLFGATILLYQQLGRDYLYDWDESIYAQLGQELRPSTLLTPTWNGELWLEKPPLIAYLTALGSQLVTDPQLGSRLFMPAATILTLWAVYMIGTHYGGVLTGTLGSIFLLSFDLFVGRSRSVNTDILLVAGICLTLALLLKNVKTPLVALALSLAVFAKGPAGLLSVIIALPLLLTKPKKYLLETLCYFLLFTLPWHLYQLIANGSAFYTPYLLEQVIRRATVPIEFHLESRWFYFAHLYRDLGVGVLLPSVLGLYFSLRQKKYLFSYWFILPLALFTLAKTRLSWYILPVYPALALSLGFLLASLAARLTPRQRFLIPLTTLALCVSVLFQLGKTIGLTRPPSPPPAHVLLATTLSAHPGARLAFLVSSSERTAEAILPKSQRLSSSFRYGGAPAVVFYSQKRVSYYYNYDDFMRDLSLGQYDLAIVTTSDENKVPPGYTFLVREGDYLAYEKVAAYANR